MRSVAAPTDMFNPAQVPTVAHDLIPLSTSPHQSAHRSHDRQQNPTDIRDERHDEAEHCAHDDRRDLTVFDVHADEHETLDRKHRSRQHRE